MRFRSVEVVNYRAIASMHLEDLGDTVIIAGPNGCGKSCVFDAIRLIKSIYGGYQPNEWQSFFGEFQIRLGQRPEEVLALMQNRSMPLTIQVEVTLAVDEVEYLQSHGLQLVKDQIWKQLVPELASWRFIGVQPMASQLRVHEETVESRAAEEWPLVQADLAAASHLGFVQVSPDGAVRSRPSRVLELIFSTYLPKRLGIVDYHGATRNYQREQVGGINLNLESAEDQMRQHSLYNYMNKYANLKTQMASGYVRRLLAEEVGGATAQADDLTETLKELFQTFFPGKQFLGPRPTADGALEFPVRTPSGATHDIDELSSGEKEVLYGYLRLRNSAPKNSVVLIDEPELHLNPRLIQGLAGFYHEHIGKALGNQLWLVTHSDTLLREAVGRPGFSVFHMQPPDHLGGANQVQEVQAEEDVERIVIELVGDLAAYRPQAKIVIFEGGGDAPFDIDMVTRLFPEFTARVNAIPGGNKRRVRDLYEVLASVEGTVPARFYAVTDRDDDDPGESEINRFSWGAYHIENYLLESEYIFRVLGELQGPRCGFGDAMEVEHELLVCAGETIDGHVMRRLRAHTNRILVGSLDLGVDPHASDVPGALLNAIGRSKQRLVEVVDRQLDDTSLRQQERAIRDEALASLQTESWRVNLRGRDILSRLVGKYGDGVSYEQVRNLIVARMRDDLHKPEGMKEVLRRIDPESVA